MIKQLNFLDLVTQTSQEVMTLYLKKKPLSLKDSSLENLHFNQYVALIRLNGEHFRIGFQVHFMILKAAGLTCKKYGSSPKDLKVEQIIDSIKEFCNETIGRLKYLLYINEIPSGHSLPFAVRGYHALLFDEFSQSTKKTCWRLESDIDSFVDCSAFYYSKDKKILKKFENLLTKKINHSKIEIF